MTPPRTIGPVCVLDRRGAPDADGAVVGGAGQQAGHHGVPAHAVDGARVTRQLRHGQLAAPVPDVNFVVCEELGERKKRGEGFN